MRYKIKDSERGHRAPLCHNEETKKINVYLPKSTQQKVKALGGSKWIRSLIEKELNNEV